MKDRCGEDHRLYDNILLFSGSEIAHKIALKPGLPPNPTAAQRATWVKHITSGLEKEFAEQTIKNIRMGCYCNENGKLDASRKFIKGIFEASKSMDDFVIKMNVHNVGWYMEDGSLFTKYFSCSCPMLEGIEILPTKTWCYCTVGFNKAIFEGVFQCEVDVELVESIKMGHKQCLMKIVPLGSIR